MTSLKPSRKIGFMTRKSSLGDLMLSRNRSRWLISKSLRSEALFSIFVIFPLDGPTLGHVFGHVGTCHVGVLFLNCLSKSGVNQPNGLSALSLKISMFQDLSFSVYE